MVTKIKKWQFFFFFLLCPLITQNSDRIILTNQPEQINVPLFKNACNQAQEVRTIFLEILHGLNEDVEYWKIQKLSPFGYFVAKGPTGWFSEKTQIQELNEKINFIKNGMEEYAFYLGKIHYYLAQNYQEKTPQEIDQAMQELLEVIAECVTPKTKENSVVPTNHADSFHLDLFATNKKNLETFKKRIEEIFDPYRQPNHFRRNWLAYSAAGIGVATLALYVYNNQEQIQQWYTTANIALHNYPQNYIYKPFTNIVEALTDNDEKSRIEQEARNEAIQTYYERQNNDQQKSWVTRTATYVSDFFFNRSKSDQRKSPKEIEQVLDKAEKGDISEFVKERNKQLQTPLQNLVFGDLVRLFGIELQQIKTQGTELLYQTRLIIALLALTPTIILGKISYTAIKDSINYCKKKNTTLLKKNMRSIHRTLNKYTSTATVTFSDQGLLLYWIFELKKSINNINIDERFSFMEDVGDLLKLTTSLEEKKAILQRMYTSYECLQAKTNS